MQGNVRRERPKVHEMGERRVSQQRMSHSAKVREDGDDSLVLSILQKKTPTTWCLNDFYIVCKLMIKSIHSET